jgi:hypothetical protein
VTSAWFFVLENQGNAKVSCFILPKDLCNVTLHHFIVRENLCNVLFPWCNGWFPRGSVTLPRFHGLENQVNVTRYHFKVRENRCNVTFLYFTGS